MFRVKKTSVRRKIRRDTILLLRQEYTGDVRANPETYNKAFAAVLHQMADAIAKVKDLWVDPEVIVWMHQKGVITAEVIL